ncbi:MAG: hypothetical protein ACYCZF_13165 [Anaerolineae bacterium]
MHLLLGKGKGFGYLNHQVAPSGVPGQRRVHRQIREWEVMPGMPGGEEHVPSAAFPDLRHKARNVKCVDGLLKATAVAGFRNGKGRPMEADADRVSRRIEKSAKV